jgi:hypothetical protein
LFARPAPLFTTFEWVKFSQALSYDLPIISSLFPLNVSHSMPGWLSSLRCAFLCFTHDCRCHPILAAQGPASGGSELIIKGLNFGTSAALVQVSCDLRFHFDGDLIP